MTSHNLRKAVAAYKEQHPGVSHTRAVGAVRAGWTPGPAAPAVYPGELGAAIPPPDWTSHAARCPAVAVLRRDASGDEIAVYDAAGGALISSLVVPHVPASAYAEFAQQQMRRSGTQPGSPAELEISHQVALGHPHRLLHRLGYEVFSQYRQWQQWSDGSWRIPARPTHYTHSVTVTTVDAATRSVRLVVLEHPDTVVLNEVVKVRFDRDGGPYFVALNRLLDRYGYVVESGLFEDIAAGVQYRRARTGRLAQRHWRIRARLRMLREVTSTPAEGRARTFKAGEMVTMQQEGAAGQEVRLGSWHSNSDLEVSYHLGDEDVEVVEVLDDWPPMHADAALDADTVTALLAPHHPGAAEAVTAWTEAGLHLAHGVSGLEIRTPAPHYRLIGRVDRDYWNKDRHSKPYTAVLRDTSEWWHNKVELDVLPHDPLAALARARHGEDEDWSWPADAPRRDLEDFVETLLRRDFPEDLVAEILEDTSSRHAGFHRLVDVCRDVAGNGPHALSAAFTALAADHTDPQQMDELLYTDLRPGWELADRLAATARD